MSEQALKLIEAQISKLEVQKKDAEASFLQMHGAIEVLKGLKTELVKPVVEEAKVEPCQTT